MSLVFEHGLTLVDTNTAGIAGGSGIFIGGARTRGRHVTAVSARAAPPRKRDYGVQAALAIGCFCLGFLYPILWIGFVLFAASAAIQINWNKTTWPQLFATWDSQYMCERCGAVGVPLPRLPHATEPVLVEAAPTPIAPARSAIASSAEAETGAQKLVPPFVHPKRRYGLPLLPARRECGIPRGDWALRER